MIKLKPMREDIGYKEIMTSLYGEPIKYDGTNNVNEFKKYMLPLMKRIYPGVYSISSAGMVETTR